MAIARLALCLLNAGYMDVWRYTQRRRSHHPTQFDSDRIEATIADHASRAWSCAPAVAAFSSTGFFPIRSLIWCVGPERPTDRPEIGDRRRVSFFLYFLHFLDRFPETCQLWKRSAEKNKAYSFSPIRLTFSPRKTCFGYQLHLLNTQRQPQFRMPYGTHLFSRVRFTTGP